mgnify:CR=1 FL=1
MEIVEPFVEAVGEILIDVAAVAALKDRAERPWVVEAFWALREAAVSSCAPFVGEEVDQTSD